MTKIRKDWGFQLSFERDPEEALLMICGILFTNEGLLRPLVLAHINTLTRSLSQSIVTDSELDGELLTLLHHLKSINHISASDLTLPDFESLADKWSDIDPIDLNDYREIQVLDELNLVHSQFYNYFDENYRIDPVKSILSAAQYLTQKADPDGSNKAVLIEYLAQTQKGLDLDELELIARNTNLDTILDPIITSIRQ